MSDPTVIGVYICGGEMRRAEAVRAGRRIEISRLESLQLTGEQASGITTHRELKETRVVASLPSVDVMSRCWALPDTDNGKLGLMIKHRLEADLPVPMEQLVWGYRRCSIANTTDNHRMVVAQAARSERIGSVLKRLTASDVCVDRLTTEAEALGALYRHGLELALTGGAVLILADVQEWLVCIVVDGLIRSIRRMRAGTERVNLVSRECRHFVESEIPAGQLNHAYWCETSPMVEARSALAEMMGIEVKVIPSASQLVTGGNALRSEQLVTYGPAIGLALAGLCEWDEMIRLAGADQTREVKATRALDRLLAYPARWAAAAIFLLILTVTTHVLAVRSETRRMRWLLESDGTHAAMAAMEPKVRMMQRLERYRIDVESIMAELTKALPDSVILSSVQLSRDHRVTLKGKTRDADAIFKFADTLRKSNRFATVNPEHTVPGERGQESEFTMSAELARVEKVSTAGSRGGRWR